MNMKYKTDKINEINETDETNKSESNNEGHDLSESMVDMLMRQIQHELYNHNLYKSYANFFFYAGLSDLSKYYECRASEELKHHDWIISYLNERGAEIKYLSTPEITEKFNDCLTPFEQTLDREIETTKLIYEIVELAQQEHDWLTFSWLMNPEKLVAEQIEEESISRTALVIAHSDDSWLSKASTILNTYNSLS